LAKTLTALRSALERDSQLPPQAAQSARECIVDCESGLKELEKKLDKISRLSSDPAVLSVWIFHRYAFREKTIAKLNATIHQSLLSHLVIAVEILNLYCGFFLME
jgi:hypothetical protein